MKVLLLIVVCAALLVPYAIGYMAPGFDVYHDDGMYLVTAKAVAEGAGYRIISLPDPIPQTRYPPMFPLALAAVWKIFPNFSQNIYALKLVPFGCAIGWLWLFFVYIRGKLGVLGPAAWLLFLSAASPWVLFSSVAFMSESMFAFFLTAVLLLIDRMLQLDRIIWWKVTLASAIAAAAILTRTAGLPLLVAGSGAFIWRRKFKESAVFLMVVIALVSPWWIWSSRHGGAIENSVNAYYGGSISANLGLLSSFSWSQRLSVLGTNIAGALISPGGLMGFIPTTFGFLLCLALAALVIYGFVLDVRDGITALNLFIFFYEGMLLLWPWPSIRFLGPVLPFLLYYAYLGLVDIAARIPRVRFPSKVAAWSCTVLVIPFASHALVMETKSALRNGTERFPLEEQKNWPATLSAMQWVSRNTPPDAILLGDDATIFLLTGRRAIGLFYFDPFEFSYARDHRDSLGSESQFISGILAAKVDYAIYASDSRGMQLRLAREQIERAAADHPAAFAEVNDPAVRSYVIFRIDRGKLEAETKK